MPRFLTTPLALFILLNLILPIFLELAVFEFRPSPETFFDRAALFRYRNIMFPTMAVLTYSNIHFGYANPGRWRWLFYSSALLNYLAYQLAGVGPLLNTIYGYSL